MRNLFDQYSQEENRLTHALAVCLNEDRALLRDFVQWIGITWPASGVKLIVTEQSLPGDPVEAEEDGERQGLPDIVIHDGESWCVFVESKIQARLTSDQLLRHTKTLTNRGFDKITRVSLTKKEDSPLSGVVSRTWSGLYEWLGNSSHRREWPERLRSYLRVAEIRFAREGYLTEGTLTMFDGFPFSEANPYTYGEAKRLLKLAMAELRKDSSLKKLGINPNAKGRDKITGTGARFVWDFLTLVAKEWPKKPNFTAYPHLTLSVRDELLAVSVTIPDKVMPPIRAKLKLLNPDELESLHSKILNRSKRLRKIGASIEAYALQRHYPSQRSLPITDARVDFKLETSRYIKGSGVRVQPEWTEMFLRILKEKRANIQFAYSVKLPWGTPGLDRREALNIIAEAWCAMEPLLDVLRGR